MLNPLPHKVITSRHKIGIQGLRVIADQPDFLGNRWRASLVRIEAKYPIACASG
jgi:hypothetical protein